MFMVVIAMFSLIPFIETTPLMSQTLKDITEQVRNIDLKAMLKAQGSHQRTRWRC